jgi:mono/diheme cytochrome c family protein
MHSNPAVKLGCADCHGGERRSVFRPASALDATERYFRERMASRPRAADLSRELALPFQRRIPNISYTLLNRESPEFVRFVNPSDYRVAREACGACHMPDHPGGERSIMATSAMLWGGAAYNNGILPFKRYILGEAYTREGERPCWPAARRSRARQL